jgi:hypothetical protein
MKSVAQQVAGLEVVLQSEENVYLRLRSVLRREEEALIELDPGEIAAIVDEKRSLAEEARLLEDSRRALTATLARALGLPDAPQKLSTLIGLLGDEAGRLPEQHARLTALIHATRGLLEANGSFSERSLRRVQETLRLLGRAVPEKVGYGPGASQVEASMGRGRLVRAAI